MQNTDYLYTVRYRVVKNHVPSFVQPAVALADFITSAAQPRCFRQTVEVFVQCGKVLVPLFPAPSLLGIPAYGFQIFLGLPGQMPDRDLCLCFVDD